MATRLGVTDERLFSTLAKHDPEALMIVSHDGRTLSQSPDSWRALFKKYTTWNIPPGVQDAKGFFMDRVVLTTEEFINHFEVFAKSALSCEAKKTVEDRGEPWRLRWHCAFPFDNRYSMTFIAQNVQETGLARSFPSDILIYLAKIAGDSRRTPEHWVEEQKPTSPTTKYLKVQIRLNLPNDFEGLSEVRSRTGLQVPVSASIVMREKLYDTFKDEYMINYLCALC